MPLLGCYTHSAIDLPYSLPISPLTPTFSPQVGEGWGEGFQTMKCHLDECFFLR